jgi:predicted DNA-binding transcriptional regulator YafY
MTFIQYAKKLEVIKYLAQHKQAGTPQQLAKKLDVSERTVQRMVGGLRNIGYPIRYNRLRLTYEAE